MMKPNYIIALFVSFFPATGVATPFNTLTVFPESYRTVTTSENRIFGHADELVNAIIDGSAPIISRLLIENPGTPDHRVVHVHQGVTALGCDRIVIIARGRNPASEQLPWLTWFGYKPVEAAGLYKINQFLSHNIFPDTPFVTFDFIDESIPDDFGCSVEQHCLRSIITQVKEKNPLARITIFGYCRGAHAVLRYLVNNPDDQTIDTLILESPYAHLEELIKQVSRSRLSSTFPEYAKWFLQAVFDYQYPHFQHSIHNDTPEQFFAHLKKITGKKIVIGHCQHDRTISQKQIDTLVEHLAPHNDLYLHSTTDAATGHAKLAPAVEFQKFINAFCAEHGMPHHAALAQEGKDVFERALQKDYTR